MSTDPGTPYRAPWWLPGGHLQTIVPALAPRARVSFRRERWNTPDDDFVDIDFAGHASAPRLLVAFHGLEGNSSSHYARSLASTFEAAGWRVAVPHFRGCSGAPNRLARAYHSGDSAEIDWLLRRFANDCDHLAAAGISLGGNALLKWLGERGEAARDLVQAAAAVSAPFDLGAAGAVLDRGLNRRVYTRMFLSTMKRKSLAKLAQHPGAYRAERLRAVSTLREFDDMVTAPLHGFRDVDDYWTRASSLPWLGHIRVRTLLVNARNDPFLPAHVLDAVPRDSKFLVLDFPATGGHVGFLEGSFPGRHGWLPRKLLHFLSRS